MNIEQTISFYLDGTLTSEQEAEFHHLLSVSPEARTLFREHMALQSVARDERTLVAPEEGLRSSLFASLAAEGMAVDAMPIGGRPYGTTPPASAIPAMVAEPSLEAFEERRDPPVAVAEMRPPRANERGEEKRRRRLLPFLIPTLLLAVAASALLLDFGGDDLQKGTPVLAEARTERSSEPVSEPRTEPRTEQAAPPVEPTAVPEISAAVAATDRGQTPERVETRPVVRSRSRIDAEVSQVADVSPQQSVAALPAVTIDSDPVVHSIPASEQIDGLNSADLIASARPVQVDDRSSASSTENLNDYARGYQRDDVVQDRGARNQEEESWERVASPEELRLTNAMVGRDPNALEDILDEKKGFLARLTDENGNPVESTLENKDAILSMLRGEGIQINPDGTFTISPENKGELAAKDVNDDLDLLASRSSKSSEKEEEIHATRLPGYFVAVEGNLATALSEARRALEWYMETPADMRSDLTTDLTLKGGIRLGEESPLMILAVAGFTEYGERTTTYNNAAASPVPPVGENEITAGRELWVGTGGRYTLEIGSNLSAGAEVILGVGEKQFHANLSAPIALKLSRAIAFEIIPTINYRNAHAPIRATTGTSNFETVLQGPADDEEWRVGAGIGFLFFLW